MKLPAVFLSHGAPTLAVDEGIETRAWAKLAQELPRPQSILVVSAHWDTRDPEVSAAPHLEKRPGQEGRVVLRKIFAQSEVTSLALFVLSGGRSRNRKSPLTHVHE